MKFAKSLKLDKSFKTLVLDEEFKKIELKTNRKNLSFAILKLDGNSFNYDNLYTFLENAAVFYALPESRINELKSSGRFAEITKETRDKFRKSEQNDGEGGEIIAYCINEDVLNARKILSKMKLKTSKNDYVKGSDGLHLLKIDDQSYEMIFVESKMYEKLSIGLYNAFNSIDRFIKGDFKHSEITTLATNLAGEINESELEFISKYIIPSKDGIKTNTAFSIFIGFQIDENEFEAIDKSLPYSDFEKNLRVLVERKINDELDLINKKLEAIERKGYSYYIYLIPFTNIDSTRKKIISKIEGKDSVK